MSADRESLIHRNYIIAVQLLTACMHTCVYIYPSIKARRCSNLY